MTHRVAVRMLELVRIDAIPNSHSRSRLDTKRSSQRAVGTDLQPTDARAAPGYRDKPSIRTIALQVAQELVDRLDRLARWRSAPDRDQRRHRGEPISATTRSRSVTR